MQPLLFRLGFCLEFSFPSRNWNVYCNCGDKSFYCDPGPLFLISSTMSICPLEPSSWTTIEYLCHSYLQFQIVCLYFLACVLRFACSNNLLLARSIKLCLVDNQWSSGVTVAGFESCWFEAGSPTSSSPQIEFINYLSEDRAWPSSIGIRYLRFTTRYNLVCLDSYLFITYIPQKAQKNS